MDGTLISIIGPIAIMVFGGIMLVLLKGVLPDEKGIRGWAKVHIWPHWPWVVTSGVLLSVTFVFLGLWLALPTPVKVEITEIEITSGSPVIRVVGISQGIPQGFSIWVVSFSHVSHRYYVQQRPGPMPTVGYEPGTRWQALAAVGASQDNKTGREFDVLAVIADQEAERFFYDHLTEGKKGEGMEGLPKGTLPARERITVILR